MNYTLKYLTFFQNTIFDFMLYLKTKNTFITLLLILSCLCTESCQTTTIDEALKKYNKGTVPYITVDELQENINYIMLDTRQKEEYNVSHLKNAIWVGYKKFNLKSVSNLDKNTTIIVYCSIGVRSEDIGEKLIKAGYTNVLNLYGGIFSWKEKGYTVVDVNDKETEKVHAYSKLWGKLLTNATKVY